MMPEWREFARRPMMAAIAALGGLLSVGASAPQSQTLSFALSNIYVPSYEDDSACPSLSLSTTDIFVQGLPSDEREVYSAPEKIQELRKLMADRLGFKMVSTGHPSGANGEMTQVPEAELVALREQNGIPFGKGTLSFLGTRFAYDSCTNPEDFPMFATGNVEYRGQIAFGEDLDGKTSAEDYRGADGSRGIDNQLIRATGCNFATRDFGSPKLADNIITSQGSPTLLEISGVDDAENDEDVTVRIYASANPLELTGQGKPLSWASLDVDPDTRFRAEVKGRIRQGELETEPFTLRVRLREQIVDSYREVWQARIRARIHPGEAIEGGIFGYHTLASIEQNYRQSTQVGADLTRMSCPALIRAVRQYADAYPDPLTGQNRAISSALRFRGVPAFLIGSNPAKAQ